MPLKSFSVSVRTRFARQTSASFISLSLRPWKKASTSCRRSSSSLLNATLGELGAALAAKKISSVELTRACLERIERHGDALNAFISVDASHALNCAREADAKRARGEAAPLTGIPIAHKDILCTRAMRT